MNIEMGFVKPTYPNEKRVALFPENVRNCAGRVVVEHGYGASVGFSDDDYEHAGATLASREEIFKICKYIYSLKLLQPCDYHLLRKGQVIVGWTHPTGSGQNFFKTVCQEKMITLVDTDSQFPRVYYMDKIGDIAFISKGFVNSNSKLAGFSAVQHALVMHGVVLNEEYKVAVLSVGNVSQGALYFLHKFSGQTDIYTRKNMTSFLRNMGEYDIIVSGIESDAGHVISKNDLSKAKRGALIIDAAADANGAIQGTRYTSIDRPIYEESGLYFYVVNNAPSIFFREASRLISASFTDNIYSLDPRRFLDVIQ